MGCSGFVAQYDTHPRPAAHAQPRSLPPASFTYLARFTTPPRTWRVRCARARAVQEVSLDSVESTLWALEKDTETDDEIMEGDPLDLGEVTAQYLALCIDPFAKHPDFVSVFGAGDGGGDGVGKGVQNPGRFGMPADGEDEVLDVEAMRAFFDADD